MSRRPLATHHEPPTGPGFHLLDTPDLQHLRFALIRVPDGEVIEHDTGADEIVLVKLEGGAQAVECDGERFALPARGSVFTDEPSAVYAPPGVTLRLHGPLLAGAYLAEARGEAPGPYAVLADEVSTVTRGSANFRREVRDIVPRDKPGTRLLVGETINPPGNWSSSPPHKHDREAPPEESDLEEIYLYRLDPEQGFGFQGSYHAEPHEAKTFKVQDLDVVSIPAGYHPVVSGPGYSLYYLWGLAGANRELTWFPDPAHAWVDTT